MPVTVTPKDMQTLINEQVAEIARLKLALIGLQRRIAETENGHKEADVAEQE